MSGNKRRRIDNERISGPVKIFKAGIADLDLLNCPICLELPKAEVYQCYKGHSVCSQCIEKLKNCPTCGVLYQAVDGQGTGKIRNHFAEEILSTVRFNCSWREQGCDKGDMTGPQVTEHEEQCSFNPSPIKLCDMLFTGACSFEVSREFLRNPVLDIPVYLQDHLFFLVRTAHSFSPQIRTTAFSGSVSTQNYSSSSMESMFFNKCTSLSSTFIRLRDNSTLNPVGFFMLLGYSYSRRSDVKKVSWYLVRVTDEPASCSVRVKFTLKSSTTPEDDGVLNCEASWNGQIMSLREFSKFRKTAVDKQEKFKFAIPMSHLREQYLKPDGGLDLHYVFTITPHADPKTADSRSNTTI